MIPQAPFGRTGHMSTRTLFGAAAFSQVTQAEADRTMELLIEYGVNHLDTAASYGESELRIGPWMAEHRDRFFLATKTGERRYEQAREEIHRSLDRLRVSHVDLLQLHNLVDPEEWEMALSAGGALDAAIEAREDGLVRWIGVTGHGSSVARMHRRSLEQFDFDSVLLPYSYTLMQNPQYAADFEALVGICEAQNVAVQTIKAITRRPYGPRPHSHATWYEPLTEQADIDRAVHWVMARPGFFLNTVGDIHVLPKVLDAASRAAERPSDEEMNALSDQEAMEPLFV